MEIISGIDELPMKSLQPGMTASICYVNLPHGKEEYLEKRSLKEHEHISAKNKEEN
jgi:hypothetical protein